MLINITARHCELDPEVRQFAEHRIEKFQRFARDIREAHLIVSCEKYRYTAEVTLKLNHHDVVSREEATEPRGAIDLTADHIEEQLRRLKDRRVDRKRDGANGEPWAEEKSPESEGGSQSESTAGHAGEE
jgi:putative sigma-54 modulation protein